MIQKRRNKINTYISFFDCFGNVVKVPESKEDIEILELIGKSLNGDKTSFAELSDLHKEILRYKTNFFMADTIESFLFCEDITIKEIAALLEIKEEVLEEYAYWFCNISEINTYFVKKAWIETTLRILKEKLEETDFEDVHLMNHLKSILFKRWALLLGREFVIWKFGLQKLTVSPSNFLETIAKEAFFHYKEISLSEKDMDYNEYAKLISSLVRTVKDINSVISQSSNNVDAITNIQEAINMVLVEEEPLNKIPALDGEIVCNSKIN